MLPLFLVSAQSVAIRREFGIGQGRIGMAVAAYFAVAAVGAVTLGPWVDRLGATQSLRVGAVITTLTALLLAVGVVRWELLPVFLGLAGLSNTVSQLASNRAVTVGSATARHGLGLGLKQAAVPIASLVAGGAVAATVDRVDWRVPFAVAAAVAAVAIFAVPRFPNDRTTRDPEPGTRWMARPRSLVTLAVAGATGATMGNALAVFAVEAGVEAGFGVAAAGALLTFGSTVSAGMRTLVGWLTGRRDSDGSLPLTVQLVAAAGAFGLLGLFGTNRVVFVVGVVAAFGSAWGFPGLIYYVAIRLHDLPPASSTAVVLTGVYLGSVVGPPFVGFVAETGSFRMVWQIAAAAMVFASLAAVLARHWADRSVG